VSASAAAPTAGSRARALLEVLRAPLLLSPVADVVAGASLVAGAAAVRSPRVGAVALAGVCLLAAGMAQNARADEADDRVRKPSRPLPRGAITRRAVGLWQAGLSVAALLLVVLANAGPPGTAPGIGWLVLGILAAATGYHAGGKRRRVLGCVLLGLCRAACLLLGMLALPAGIAARAAGAGAWQTALAWPHASALAPAPLAALLYGLYVFGASLHASSDDEPGASPWSARGTRVALVVLAGLLALVAGTLALDLPVPPVVAGAVEAGRRVGRPALLAAAVLLVWAGVRLLRARGRVPPPVLTGVLLSNVYLVDAAWCAMAGAPLGALLVVALFAASRLMLRTFPPS